MYYNKIDRCRATEPYSSGTCTFNVLLLMQCLHLCTMCANHTYNAHIHTSTLEHFEYYNISKISTVITSAYLVIPQHDVRRETKDVMYMQ